MAFFSWCKRYMSLFLVLILGLYAYILFFDDNSYGHIAELNERIDELHTEIEATRDSMNYYRDLNVKLKSSPEEIDRVARERYFMQGPNEDVYIVE